MAVLARSSYTMRLQECLGCQALLPRLGIQLGCLLGDGLAGELPGLCCKLHSCRSWHSFVASTSWKMYASSSLDLKEAGRRQKSKAGVLVCLGRRQLFHATQLLFQLRSDGNLQLRLFPHHDGGHCAGICGSSCRTQHGSCKRLASYVCDHMPLLRCPSSIAMILSI